MSKQRQAVSALLGIASAAVLAAVASADILNVPSGFPTIQAGIDAAQDGDEVVVAAGTYLETIDFLGKAIIVRSSDGPKVTTIDATGMPNATVVRCESLEGPFSILQGFTITGGTNSGMRIVNSAPTVTDCTFTQNSAWQGGGIYIQDSFPTVTGCTFIGNSTTTDGGGIYQQQGVINPTVTSCTFIDNTANNDGGGMWNWGPLTMTNCTFGQNVAGGGDGGGLFNQGNNNQTITACVFNGNVASGSGTGGGLKNLSNNAAVTACTFDGNSAGNDGGGLATNWAVAVTDCTFTGNSASTGGGLSVGTSGSTGVTGLTFCDNQPNDFIVGLVPLSNISSCDPCPADINGDGLVNSADLTLLLGAWAAGGCP